MGIQSEGGQCIVSSVTGSTETPLQVKDTIVSLNGIDLANVQGGVDAWVKLFAAFADVERNLVILRPCTSLSPRKKKRKSNAPNQSPKKRKSGSSDSGSARKPSEVICLLEDSDDEVAAPVPAAAPPAAAARRVDDSDDEVEVVDVPVQGWQSVVNSPKGNLKDDRSPNNSSSTRETKADEDECAIVGSKGQNALVDFPHSRANCVSRPFTGDKLVHCDNCYCYVCDIPASECKAWPSHCGATHGDPRWRAEREAAKRRRRLGGSAPTAAPRPAAVPAPRPAAAILDRLIQHRRAQAASRNSSTSAPDVALSMRALLERVTGRSFALTFLNFPPTLC